MAKLTDPQKDKENDSFVNFVITQMVCKDPWGRLVQAMPENTFKNKSLTSNI